MDKRNSAYRIIEMLKGKEGQVLSLHELKALIMANLGSNERTITSHLHTMDSMGLLKDLGNSKFEIIKKWK